MLKGLEAEQIEHNCHYNSSTIATIAEVLFLCGTQEIALQGHQESETSMNRENIIENLDVIVAHHDPIVHHDLMMVPRIHHTPHQEFKTHY